MDASNLCAWCGERHALTALCAAPRPRARGITRRSFVALVASCAAGAAFLPSLPSAPSFADTFVYPPDCAGFVRKVLAVWDENTWEPSTIGCVPVGFPLHVPAATVRHRLPTVDVPRQSRDTR